MMLLHAFRALFDARLPAGVNGEDGFEIAQALALAAAAIFATIAIFQIFQTGGVNLVNQLFTTISGGL